MPRSRPNSMEASSDLVGRSLTRAATPECLGEFSSPSEPAEDAGERCLCSGLHQEAEPVPELAPPGERPRPSMSSGSFGSAPRNRLTDPTAAPFLGRGLPDLFRIFMRWMGASRVMKVLKIMCQHRSTRETRPHCCIAKPRPTEPI